ncbi:hypothetical protein [Streptomyces cinereoruber]|uniref:hypothetical protein n=1 Tax=Streptomyces cinereoruber TaxID=67260 RepID=UPI00364539D0
MTGPDDPMLRTLREEIWTGTWPRGTLRTKESLRRRFGVPFTHASAVVSVLRREGLVETQKGNGVRARPKGDQPNAPGPLFHGDRIVATIRERVQSGVYPLGLRLPNQTVLGQEFFVGAQGARIALIELMLEGVLRPARSGEMSGTYPVDHVREQREERLVYDLRDAMNRGGWWRAEFPEAVERAMKTLLTDLQAQTLRLHGFGG